MVAGTFRVCSLVSPTLSPSQASEAPQMCYVSGSKEQVVAGCGQRAPGIAPKLPGVQERVARVRPVRLSVPRALGGVLQTPVSSSDRTYVLKATGQSARGQGHAPSLIRGKSPSSPPPGPLAVPGLSYIALVFPSSSRGLLSCILSLCVLVFAR